MKKSFIEKVKRNGIVDTQKYRYIYEKYIDKAVLKRAPIELVFYPWLGSYDSIKWKTTKEWY